MSAAERTLRVLSLSKHVNYPAWLPMQEYVSTPGGLLKTMMHLMTVRLDRIFDVVHGLHNGREVTFFGFQYGKKRMFGICAPGLHNLAPCTVLTACLRTMNDWTTLAGWYNHSTGETVVESAYAEIAFVIVAAVIAAVAFQKADLVPLAMFVALSGMAFGVRSLQLVWFMRQVKAELARVKSAPVPSLELPPDSE